MSTISLLLRILLLEASFIGLCAAVRVRFRLDPCVAPFTACCCIIVTLMLGGMLGILQPALWALYALGFAGLIYAYAFKKSAPPCGLFAAGALFVAFLILRFHGAHFWTNDDVSHWGLVARHLIRHDRFPTGQDTYIFFQSYPLGLACFIYYILNLLGSSEPMLVIAQNFLLGCLFLPVFSLVKERKAVFYPICTALYFMFAALSLFQVLLAADLPQPFFAIGASAAILRYRSDWKRACISALPALVAVTYAKSSGLYFALLTAVVLFCAVRRGGLPRRRLPACAVAFALIPLAAYFLWYLHIRFRFPAALDSKHAVSLAAYARAFNSKGPGVIRQIAIRQLRAFYHLEKAQVLAVPLLFLMSIVLFFSTRRLARSARRRYLSAYLFAVASYLVWYVLVFFMYVFSMPEGEALALASFSRYNGTGLVYMDGIIALLMLTALQRRDALPLPVLRLGSVASALCAALLVAIVLWPGDRGFLSVVLRKYDTAYPQQLVDLATARDRYDLPCGGHYLVAFYHDEHSNTQSARRIYYNIKYELETADIELIGFNEADHPGKYYVGTREDVEATERPSDFIANKIDECDAVLILDPDPRFDALFDAFMRDYDGDTPVYRTYQLSGAA